ncbi:MAG: hypothetical protein KDA24_23295 [Deltaproteobacteria bacterium]|nr:hypothetical protein [Deltaproteobacteria bacterium]
MDHPIPPAQGHGPLAEVFPNVYFVTGSMGFGAMRFSRNMVVLREDERLIIVNSLRLDDAGLAELDTLGKVTDVVRLAGGHGSDDRFYKQRYGATVWAMRGQTYFTGTDPDKGSEYFTPDGYLDEESDLPVRGASLFLFETAPSEGVLRIEAGGGTLIAGDSLQHWHSTAGPHFNLLAKVGMRILGFIKPHQLGPGWVKACRPSGTKLRSLLDLAFENVLPAHGDVVRGGAREAYRPAIEAWASKLD